MAMSHIHFVLAIYLFEFLLLLCIKFYTQQSVSLPLDIPNSLNMNRNPDANIMWPSICKNRVETGRMEQHRKSYETLRIAISGNGIEINIGKTNKRNWYRPSIATIQKFFAFSMQFLQKE